jgi:hypothetical protein
VAFSWTPAGDEVFYDDGRLTFADWLEERGSPRGEFIRFQGDLVKPGDLPNRDFGIIASAAVNRPQGPASHHLPTAACSACCLVLPPLVQ